jgi:hypothetical protein
VVLEVEDRESERAKQIGRWGIEDLANVSDVYES